MTDPQAGTDTILAWEDDPGAPPSTRTAIVRPRPDLAAGPLPVGIHGAVPGAGEPGTAPFRYWTAAESLRRTADYFGPLMPDGVTWFPTVGDTLMIGLDEGDDLNAYYDRAGLAFFHHTVGDLTVHSGESPDVVAHETGHAVLDALRPQLWDAASAEVAGFHESFGDMTALLAGLQLESVRVGVLAETGGRLTRASRLSRLAEQLGWAIRTVAPAAVDADCLRNAANRFFYQDPVTLPPSAPANVLSSESHSFSRVFTGAFLRVLAGIHRARPTRDPAGLLAASTHAGQLLVAGVRAAPVVPAYYAQVAAHMLAAEIELFEGRYARALRSAFVRHGILAPAGAAAVTTGTRPLAAPVPFGPLSAMTVPGDDYGLSEGFRVLAPGQPPRFTVTGAAPERGQLPAGDGRRVAASFVEDLFRQGRVRVDEEYLTDAAVVEGGRTMTHAITRDEQGLVLVRRMFD